jgi:hypothetical protein
MNTEFDLYVRENKTPTVIRIEGFQTVTVSMSCFSEG